jgi:DNA-directed RNA polymerase II subunit RPB11
MNAPDVSEAVFLRDDERKVVIVKDAKLPNAASFFISKEDHTLGNVLRHSLLRDRDVKFVGYRMMHPLQNVLEIKVQTHSDGASPLNAMISSLEALRNEFELLQNKFSNATMKARKGKEEDFEKLFPTG